MSSTEPDFSSGRQVKGNAASLAAAQKDSDAHAPGTSIVVACTPKEKPKNIITAVIEGDELVLKHTNFGDPVATTLSRVTVRLEHTIPAQVPGDLGITLTFGGQIACQVGGADIASGYAGATTLTVDVKGVSQGKCTVTAQASGSAGGDWTFADAAEHEIWVEHLRMDAKLYSDGRRVAGDQDNPSPGTPKSRELHQKKDDVFTFARCEVHKPSDDFWQKATKVTLSPSGPVAAFSNDTATDALTELTQGDFAAGNKTFWVASTVFDGRDTEVESDRDDKDKFGTAGNFKDFKPGHISCGSDGASLTGTLQNADMLELKTYSFDRYLDRKVRRECIEEVAGGANLKNRCAIARAGHHKYYDKESDFEFNHADRNDGSNAFVSFIDAIHGGSDAADGVLRGVAFVSNHMKEKKKGLSAKMLGAIRDHIEQRVVANGGWARDHATWGAKTDTQKSNSDAYGFQRHFKIPGSHAEVIAANAVLEDSARRGDVTVATYKLQGGRSGRRGGQNLRFRACDNCAGILKDFRVITDVDPI